MEFQRNIPLAEHSNFKIGGPARYFFEATTVDELIEAVKEARLLNEPIFILGGGNNLLISDAGFKGVVIKPAIRHTNADEQQVVRVGAGVLLSEFLEFCVQNGLSGWEWAGGLPSTMGGAIWGNAGAFGGETKDRVIEVVSLSLTSAEPHLIRRNRSECQFGYRSSIFKNEKPEPGSVNAGLGMSEIIIEASFQLEKGERSAIQAAIDEKKEYRRNKQPLEYPNIGSIFKNTPVAKIPPAVLEQFKEKIKNDPFPVLPTAVLNAAAGLKGYRVGGAQISEKHANFIINAGGATAADVRAIMAHIRTTIKEKFGVELEQEVIEVGG